MHEKLTAILQHKQQEVARLHKQMELIYRQCQNCRPRKSLVNALRRRGFINLITEIKRRSPAKGELAAITDPVSLAHAYANSGAAAISVLTDSFGFGGAAVDLSAVAEALTETAIPILRKDFLIDPLQIFEAITLGADAVLLIVSILGEQLKPMLDQAKTLGIDALVEAHTVAEIEQAIGAGAEIIGVNNRNLQTFELSTETAFALVQHLPDSVIKIAESGILQPGLARDYYAAGYDAVLVGEALVKAPDPAQWIAEAQNIPSPLVGEG